MEIFYDFPDLFRVPNLMVRKQPEPVVEIEAAQKRMWPAIQAQIPAVVFLQKGSHCASSVRKASQCTGERANKTPI